MPQTKVSFCNAHTGMIEQFHQLDQSQFRVLGVHVVDLSAKCLSERMATEVLDLQTVLPLNFFQHHIDTLHGKDRAFLADQDVRV